MSAVLVDVSRRKYRTKKLTYYLLKYYIRNIWFQMALNSINHRALHYPFDILTPSIDVLSSIPI